MRGEKGEGLVSLGSAHAPKTTGHIPTGEQRSSFKSNTKESVKTTKIRSNGHHLIITIFEKKGNYKKERAERRRVGR